MTSQRYLTYHDALAMFAERGAEREDPIRVRQNTLVRFKDYKETMKFELVLYGSHIATLYNNGTVQVWSRNQMTNTTKNRLNDVLIPLGWKIAVRHDKWVIVQADSLGRNVSGNTLDWVEGRLVRPRRGSHVSNTAQLINN